MRYGAPSETWIMRNSEILTFQRLAELNYLTSMKDFTPMTFFPLLWILSTVNTLADPNRQLVAHFIFRRHEPTAFQYLSIQASMFLLLSTLLQNSISTGLLLLSVFNVFLGVHIAFYRLVWHDLRSFPGPKIAALTQGWILKEAYLGRTRFTMKELGEKYGEWVRIGPNELYTTSIEALYTIMGAKGWPKGPSYDSGITKGESGGDSVLTIKTRQFHMPEHAIRRRIWTKAFTPKAIAEYLPSVDARLEEMLNIIDDHVKQKKSVDLCLQIGCFVYNTMCDMAYGGLVMTRRRNTLNFPASYGILILLYVFHLREQIYQRIRRKSIAS
ncbi:cytochrome P450 67 [Puccinia sorghi]|uniref:Cytochrome P450 67 n=1 Tax=Puccinia sorghi TaxID=27349 RepID=A0A0L6UT50_9BASI|nr:cytochrome P450 67 [Puccinia sorghi]